jgi:hypothetical protein
MGPGEVIIVFLLAASSVAQEGSEPPARKTKPAPQSPQPPITRPSELDKARLEFKPPSLAVTGTEAAQAARAFIDWAGASTVRQREEVRRLISEARENRDVAAAFCDEAFRAVEADHSRAILVLSLLGEMRSPVGEDCLRKVLHQPFPENGTLAHGEIVEQTAVGMLQAKAVDGLAYLRSAKADEEVLWAVAKHPSRIVRAEAIAAYLWNHNDSADARAVLQKYVRRDEAIFLDRLRREPEESAEVFNRKLGVFVKAHPELAPPPPKRADRKKRPQPPGTNKPPIR